ncbi:MAG: hypothetical protein E6Q65_06050 [Ottowia sp.]|nr:MAG: hypothetical protein E6Q65_06050 [Ottowia sp.]
MQATLKPEPEAGHDPCTQLLVRSWRLIMVRGVECPLVTHEFRCACGLDGREVLRAFCAFLCALAFSQRRRLWVNPPGEPRLTADETDMLRLIAAAQNGCAPLLDAQLSGLARQPLRAGLEHSVRGLGALLQARQMRLPRPA